MQRLAAVLRQRMAEFLADGPGTLLGRATNSKDPVEVIKTLVRSSLGRDARADEIAALSDYLASRADRRSEAYRQILWALLTGPEFRFNH